NSPAARTTSRFTPSAPGGCPACGTYARSRDATSRQRIDPINQASASAISKRTGYPPGAGGVE
ncbi:hypothetical protein, partial [Dysgonomonas sp. 521]|uniref:hypothetical protein n=1 Tax=Dysgonomonas sp. 521 TaxID=2302932 RepID=UPI001C868F78